MASASVLSGKATRNADLVEAIREVLPEFQADLPPGGNANSRYLDLGRISSELGYRPQIGTERGLGVYRVRRVAALPADLRIRAARADDAAALARLHVEAWQWAYRGHLRLVPGWPVSDDSASRGVAQPPPGRYEFCEPHVGRRAEWQDR